jgi:hypothetical protein
MHITVDLTQYQLKNGKAKNTVAITDTPKGQAAIDLLQTTTFGTSYHASFDGTTNPATGAASVDNDFLVTIKAWDDPDGSKGWTKAIPEHVTACVTETTTTTTTTETSTPTKTTTTTETTTSETSGTAAPTTTTSALVAAATTTTTVGGGTLPYTGVNLGVPLGIAGALVLVGGGLLFWLRFNARRRNVN